MTHVILPTQALQEIVDRKGSLELTMEQAVVQVDATALETILSQGNAEEVTLQLQQVSTENLKKPQKQALETRNVVSVLSAKIFCGNNSIHDFGGGQVILRIPFTPEPGMGYQIIYVAEDGSVTVVPHTYENGFLQFSTGHFSEYAIVKDPTAPPTQETEGDFPWLIPVAGVAVVGAVAVCLAWKRRKK